MAKRIKSSATLTRAFARFEELLDAVSVPTADGGRQIVGVAHALALSEATDVLHQELWAAGRQLVEQHGYVVSSIPMMLTVLEADHPDGPWEAVPWDGMRIQVMKLGGEGADARLCAALEGATKVTAFPLTRWNALQRACPGGKHCRWRVGDVFTAEQLAVLESAKKLLRLVSRRSSAPPPPDRVLKKSTSRDVARDEPFIPNAYQQLILAALIGKALRTDALASQVKSRRKLFTPDGLGQLRDNGLVLNHRRIGYYRPDAPPPEFAELLAPKSHRRRTK